MNKIKILLVPVLGLSLLVLFVIPVKTAYTGTIPFRVGTKLPDLLFISCKGPFGRISRCIRVDNPPPDVDNPPLVFKLFYSAEINFFSPYGEWRCDVYGFPGCTSGVAGAKVFTIPRHPVPEKQVDLTIVKCDGCSGYVIKVETDQTCCPVSTSAFLGDRPQQTKPDRDTFSFAGAEGDEITLRLEEDGSVGHIGEQANFKLRGPVGSVSLDEFRTGELPLEITATIPESGEYEIVVDQKDISDDLSYRGGYVITLDQSLDDVKEIVPSQDVE
jgi:hypothetical protein